MRRWPKAVEAAARRGIRVRALVLSGEPHAENERTLGERLAGIAILRLPQLADVGESTLDEWIDASDLESVLP